MDQRIGSANTGLVHASVIRGMSMGSCRWLCAFASMSFLMCSPVFAGAPSVGEYSCGETKGARVQTRVDPRQRYFAVAGQAFTGSTPTNAYEIRINPERTYLGKATQEWLYLRQCAHINLRHEVLRGEQGRKLRDEEEADCWAVQELIKKSGTSSRILYSIESDMERVVNNAERWREVLPGPPRRVQLSSCLRK